MLFQTVRHQCWNILKTHVTDTNSLKVEWNLSAGRSTVDASSSSDKKITAPESEIHIRNANSILWLTLTPFNQVIGVIVRQAKPQLQREGRGVRKTPDISSKRSKFPFQLPRLHVRGPTLAPSCHRIGGRRTELTALPVTALSFH